MERLRPTLFLIVVAAGALLAACGGGNSPAGFISSGAPLPELQLQPKAVKLAVKPLKLAFSGVGKAFAKKVVVSEKGYTGKFVEHSTCKGIVKASPLSGKGPKMTVKITPMGTGTCAITFQDAKKHKAKLSISSGTAPTPTPTGSPTNNPTGGPTGSPGPTPTPSLPATIFVTYTALTAHPNVVAYDAQGNRKSSGSWSGAGVAPQSIAWAPGDLNWFYLTNGTTNTVKVYSSGGGQLSFFTGVTDTGAIAYPTGSSNLLFVASPSANTIHAYDQDGNVKATPFPTNIDTTLGGMTYDNNDGRLYVSNTSSGNVEYYSPTTGSLGSSISEPGGCTCTPGAIAFDAANNDIYVWWSGTGGGMSAYTESGTAVTLTSSSGMPFAGLSSPQAIAYDSDNQHLYVTDGASGKVLVFDAMGNAIVTNGNFSPGFTATSANGITFK